MDKISMSRAQVDLENMFGLLSVRTVNNEGNKPKLVSKVKVGFGGVERAVGQVIGLVLLTVVSLIAFIILCALRNNLKNKFIELQTQILQVNSKTLPNEISNRNQEFIRSVKPATIPEDAKFDPDQPFKTKSKVYEGEPIDCYNLHKLSKGEVVCVHTGSAYTDNVGNQCNNERIEFLLLETVIHDDVTNTSRISIILKDKSSNVVRKTSIFGLYFLTKEDQQKLDNFKKED